VPTDPSLAQAGGPFQACENCGALYTSAGAVTSACPAGGAHSPASPVQYRLMSNWASTIGDDRWRLCANCGAVVDQGMVGAPCPGGTGMHNLAASGRLGACFVDYQLDRDFFVHEMGHAYGFEHGRSSEPQSWTLENDCNPGAYGDPFDIMSYGDVYRYAPQPSDADAGWGYRGPSLAVHQLEYAGLIPPEAIKTVDGSEAIATVTLRPAARSELPGFAAAHIGSLIAEYRPAAGWDAGLQVDGPGAVLIYDTAVPGSMILHSTAGRKFLRRFDTVETANLGRLGGWSITVSRLDGTSATIEVARQHSFSYGWQRWVVLPCAYQASGPPPLSMEELRELFMGRTDDPATKDVESFWNDMAGGGFHVAGGWVVSAGGNVSTDWIPLGYGSLQDETRPPGDRVRAAVHASLALKNPTRASAPLYLDWEAFTGIIVVRNEDVGSGFLGELQLPTGNTLPYRIDCRHETNTGSATGERLFQVIELGSGALSHAGIAREIGHSLGLSDRPDDPFTLMSTHPEAYRDVDPGHPNWGKFGPELDTDGLTQLGWLPDSRVFRVTPPQGQRVTAGSVLLVPWAHARGAFAGGEWRAPSFARIEAGPYSFECRSRDGWDSGLPADLPAVVVARNMTGGPPTPKVEGQSVSWGGELRAITGGGEIRVRSLSPAGAEVDYYVAEKRVIVAGGGSLAGGGTFLITPDGRIIRIPPGDPFERQVAPGIDRLSTVFKRIRSSRTLEQHVERTPSVIAGGIAFDGGGGLLFARNGVIEIPPGNQFDLEIAPEIDRLSSLAERIRGFRPAGPP
jgi:hypothetical protein